MIRYCGQVPGGGGGNEGGAFEEQGSDGGAGIGLCGDVELGDADV